MCVPGYLGPSGEGEIRDCGDKSNAEASDRWAGREVIEEALLLPKEGPSPGRHSTKGNGDKTASAVGQDEEAPANGRRRLSWAPLANWGHGYEAAGSSGAGTGAAPV